MQNLSNWPFPSSFDANGISIPKESPHPQVEIPQEVLQEIPLWCPNRDYRVIPIQLPSSYQYGD